MEDAEIAEIVEDAPAAEGPAPAPAATLEIVHERPHSKSKKSQQRTLGGQPVHIVTFIGTLFQPGLVDTQYNVLTFCETCKYSYFSFFALLHTYRAVIQLILRPGIQSYRSTSFRTNNLRIHTLLKFNK